MSPVLPTLFVSHGAPDILLSQQVSVNTLQELGSRPPKPRAIVVVSVRLEFVIFS